MAILKTSSPATRPRLGKPLAKYPGKPLTHWQLWFGYAPAIGLALALTWIGFQRVALAQAYGPTAVATWGKPWFISAALVLLLPLAQALLHWRSRKQVVVRCENGLHFKHFRRKPFNLFWNQVAGIQTDSRQWLLFNLVLHQSYRVVLLPAAGKPIYLNQTIAKLPELAEHIKQNIYPILTPQLSQQLKQGQWVFFGPIHLHKETLRRNRKQISWESIEKMEVENGYLMLKLRNQGVYRTSTRKIPNLEIVLSLVEEEIAR